ncbi:hypothetical protein CANCADRAFT_4519 [Tortispora caseinolytica NRRL Y-17796]|uniref:V-type proton ATPase subunit n=1 Tax=Tortispora caseinolytica NRRL Y-17796 TaxID=767744 RepID=A0A1E4T9G5_9ASCO|nr:hypothetical protein CANCADRAFT_4519 [Tortispora caseinolytica NRRL Y-17796]
MEGLYFNINTGYLDALIRGYRNGLLSSANYINLTQCESLEDVKLQLSATEYSTFLSNVGGQLSTSIISQHATGKLIEEYQYFRSQAVEPLTTLMDYISYGYMIDNMALLITGTLHERDTHELLDRCHPLGWFDTMPALCVATSIDELYNLVLVDTPLAKFFRETVTAADLDDLNIEIIRNSLYKSYLEDFYEWAGKQESPTRENLQSLLEFEADRRIINIALNSFGSELTPEHRLALFPQFGSVWETAAKQLARADDFDQARIAIESVGIYKSLFDSSGGQSIEDHFYRREMELCKAVFTQQFSYAVIWAWLKAREQEIRNITWISECIAQNQKERIQNFISVF